MELLRGKHKMQILQRQLFFPEKTLRHEIRKVFPKKKELFARNWHRFHPSKSENLSKFAKIKSEDLSIFG